MEIYDILTQFHGIQEKLNKYNKIWDILYHMKLNGKIHYVEGFNDRLIVDKEEFHKLMKELGVEP